jgi:hypothetical protein
MAILAIFILGIGNFAMQGAVIEDRDRLFARLPGVLKLLGARASQIAEFAVLLGALLLVANGDVQWGWAYLFYTLFNGIAAWLILSHRF